MQERNDVTGGGLFDGGADPAKAHADALLVDRAGPIVAAHRLAESSARQALSHAIEAGRLLLAVKGDLPHGAFGPWLADHVGVAERTCQLYMRLARNGPAVDRVAAATPGLTVAAAAKAIGNPRPARTPELPPHLAAIPLDKRRDTATAYPDILHTWAVLLAAVGLTEAETADALGLDIAAVAAKLRPTLPTLYGWQRLGDRGHALSAGATAEARSVLLGWRSKAVRNAIHHAENDGLPVAVLAGLQADAGWLAVEYRAVRSPVTALIVDDDSGDDGDD